MVFLFLLKCWFSNLSNNVNLNQTYQLSETVQLLQHRKFNRHQNTVLYIHGYVESPFSGTVQSIVNAYIKRSTYNILVLDWSALVNGSYVTAVTNTVEVLLELFMTSKNLIEEALKLLTRNVEWIKVGPTISSTLINAFSKGLNRWSFHIVGHSLGGQLAGIIGRSIIQLSANKIKLQRFDWEDFRDEFSLFHIGNCHRISALDPAFPGFYPPLNLTSPIDVNVANLVDVIHTDAQNYGAPVNTGCVDFIVNDGIRFQPGCPVGNFTALSANGMNIFPRLSLKFGS